jgi:hypothetical protein
MMLALLSIFPAASSHYLPTTSSGTDTISNLCKHTSGNSIRRHAGISGLSRWDLYSTEDTGGAPLDGKFSFSVLGNQNHDIRVYDGQFNYPQTMCFSRGVQKIISVESGTAVYI